MRPAYLGWRLRGNPDSRLGPRLRAARQRAGMTQSQVAAAVGKTKATVSYWERGARGISYDDLIAYGAAVHASVADLVGVDLPMMEEAS